MAQDSLNYKFFLDTPPSDQFLFNIRLIKNFAPKVGDSITDPVTFREFKITRKELVDEQGFVRVTDQGDFRVTDDGAFRVTKEITPLKDQTFNYFITPANNPQRISSYTTIKFDDDRTLQQLFR